MSDFNNQLMKSANNCWDLFNKVPQEIKTRIITLGLLQLVSNFEGLERRRFLDVITARRNKD